MIRSPFRWPTPRAAYVHVPFCRHRCGYCNFSVVAGRDDLIDRFLDAIEFELAQLDSPTIDTLFIGGGTPTYFQPDQLARFFRIVTRHFQLADNYEWTIEANPEDIDDARLDVIFAAGVNRVSLGVQSFASEKLKSLERGHTGEQASDVVKKVAAVIQNVSVDLIFAAPGETLTQWSSDLSRAMSLPIAHLSTYALTYEKGTQFWNRKQRGELTPASEPAEVGMYRLARERTSANGFDHYEISNFAKPTFTCRHNVTYWEGRGWYAAGPGATRFVDGVRAANHRSTTTYLKRIESGRSPVAETESITPQQHARERAAFGIRMISGIDLDSLSAETGSDLNQLYAQTIDELRSQGLVMLSGNHLRLTSKGVMFADLVARELL